MKRLRIILVLCILVLCMSNISFATLDALTSPVPQTIKVQQNGEYIDFTDSEGNVVEPQIINSRTMVPFRKIFNSLGVTDSNITWDGETKKVVAKKDDIVIELQIDNDIAKKTVSGETSEIKLDSAPVIIEGRTLVPVRFIAESMNKQVGWDDYYKTVIILDTEGIMKDIEKSVPKFMEIANADVKKLDEYSNKMKLTGKLDYKQSSNKSYNSTINLEGTINYRQNKEAIAIDIDAKLTGKGELFDSLKEIGITSLDLNLVAIGNKIYLKSSFLESQAKGKWVVQEDDTIAEALKALNSEKTDITKVFVIKDEDLNINTYESLSLSAQIIKTLLKDENIKITEKGSTKNYEINISLSDLFSALGGLGVGNPAQGGNGGIKINSSYKKGVPQSDSSEINYSYTEGDESVVFSLKSEGKVSEGKVTISEPSASQVMSVDEIQPEVTQSY